VLAMGSALGVSVLAERAQGVCHLGHRRVDFRRILRFSAIS
jgi:hypothetical protein